MLSHVCWLPSSLSDSLQEVSETGIGIENLRISLGFNTSSKNDKSEVYFNRLNAEMFHIAFFKGPVCRIWGDLVAEMEYIKINCVFVAIEWAFYIDGGSSPTVLHRHVSTYF